MILMKNERGSVLPLYILLIPVSFLILTIVTDVFHVFIARQALSGVADAAAAAVVKEVSTTIHGEETCRYVDDTPDDCYFVPQSIEIKIADGSATKAKTIADNFIQINDSALKGFENIQTYSSFYRRNLKDNQIVKDTSGLPVTVNPDNTYKFDIEGDMPVILLGVLGRLFGMQDNIQTIKLKVTGYATPQVVIDWDTVR